MPNDSSDFETVAFFPSRLEADIAAGELRANGITVLISAPDAGGVLPIGIEGTRILVPADQAEDARELLGPEIASEAPTEQEPKRMGVGNWVALVLVALFLIWFVVKAFQSAERGDRLDPSRAAETIPG